MSLHSAVVCVCIIIYIYDYTDFNERNLMIHCSERIFHCGKLVCLNSSNIMVQKPIY